MVSTIYLDTSALMKRYLTEAGSGWIKALLDAGQATTSLTSHLTVIEGVCTFARRRREGLLSPEDYLQLLAAFDYDFRYRYDVIAVEPMVIDTARQLAERNPLRAYDAVQLASAWLADQKLVQARRSPLTFISADDRLLAVAQAEGLSTDNPNRHP
jgi:predicted nucleic acid-binding protein